MLKDEPCKKCGLTDKYVKGEYSSCRYCHNEAQKRYMENKARGEQLKIMPAPSQTLEFMLTSGRKGSPRRAKTHCSNGHPFAGDNVAITSQHNGKHLRRRCRACDRNLKRVKYGVVPEPTPTRLSDILDC
jgi:hypothetical protein